MEYDVKLNRKWYLVLRFLVKTSLTKKEVKQILNFWCLIYKTFLTNAKYECWEILC